MTPPLTWNRRRAGCCFFTCTGMPAWMPACSIWPASCALPHRHGEGCNFCAVQCPVSLVEGFRGRQSHPRTPPRRRQSPTLCCWDSRRCPACYHQSAIYEGRLHRQRTPHERLWLLEGKQIAAESRLRTSWHVSADGGCFAVLQPRIRSEAKCEPCASQQGGWQDCRWPSAKQRCGNCTGASVVSVNSTTHTVSMGLDETHPSPTAPDRTPHHCIRRGGPLLLQPLRTTQVVIDVYRHDNSHTHVG